MSDEGEKRKKDRQQRVTVAIEIHVLYYAWSSISCFPHSTVTVTVIESLTLGIWVPTVDLKLLHVVWLRLRCDILVVECHLLSGILSR